MKKLLIILCLCLVCRVGWGEEIIEIGEELNLTWETTFSFDGVDNWIYEEKVYKSFKEMIETITGNLEARIEKLETELEENYVKKTFFNTPISELLNKHK